MVVKHVPLNMESVQVFFFDSVRLEAAGCLLDQDGGLSSSYLKGVLTSTWEGSLLVWYEEDLLHPKAAAVCRPEGGGLEVVAACAAPGLGLMNSLLAAFKDRVTMFHVATSNCAFWWQ